MRFSGGYCPRRLSGTGRCWGLVVLLASALLVDASFAQAPSGTAKLVEVRVGKHPGYTRIVFETDVPTTYEVVQEAGVLRVRLSAQGKAGTIAARSPLVRAVQLEPGSGGTVAQVQLTKGAVNVKPMVLRNPPRIVLDLTPKPVGVAEAATATAPGAAPPKPAPKAATAPAPAPAAERPAAATAAAAPGAAPQPAAEPSGTKPEPSARDASKEASAATRPSGAAGGATPGAAKQPVAKAPAPGPDSAAGAAVGHPEDAAARRAAALARTAGRKPTSVEIVKPEPRAKAPPRGPRPAPPPARPADERPVAPVGTAEEGGLVALLTSPTVLAGVAGLVALIGGLLFVRRRGAAEVEVSPFASDSPFAVDPIPGDEHPVADSAYGEGEATGFETEPGREGGQASIFDVPEEDIPDDDKDDAPISAAVAAAGAAPFVSASGSPTESAEEAELEESVMRLVQDLERRVAHMESRMEELSDTKERLERQVAAQTEELRVQRAAIARTQRVLRTVARSEEEATEPAPKT